MSDASLLRWLGTFPAVTAPCSSVDELCDGVALLEAFSEIDRTVDVGAIQRDVGGDRTLAAQNLRTLATHMERFYVDELREAADLSHFDADAAAQQGAGGGASARAAGVVELAQLMLGCVIKCGDNQTFISSILGMDEDKQQDLQGVVSDVMERFPKLDDADTPRSPAPVEEPAPQPRSSYEPEPDEFGVGEMVQQQLEEIERLTTDNARLDELHRTTTGRAETLELANEKLTAEARARRSTADDGEWKIKQLEFDRDEKQAKIEELQKTLERRDVGARE
jgi:hypothetical protein